MAADLCRIDAYSEAAMLAVSWRQHRCADLRQLTPEQAASCALEALAEWRSQAGPVPTDDLAIMLVAALMHARPRMPVRQRSDLLADALRACRLGAGEKSIERLIARARAGQDS